MPKTIEKLKTLKVGTFVKTRKGAIGRIKSPEALGYVRVAFNDVVFHYPDYQSEGVYYYYGMDTPCEDDIVEVLTRDTNPELYL
jgi:hypothetical protein